MICDAAVPAGAEPAGRGIGVPAGAEWAAARWSAAELARLAEAVSRGGAALRALPDRRLLEVWLEVAAEFRDPGSAPRRRLDPALAGLCGLSPAGLAAALDSVLGSVTGEAVRRLAAEARPAAATTPVLVLLASNLPALAVQPLLPALLLRRPVILKSPSAEPLFAPAFVRRLSAREPALGGAVAAVTWKGGDEALEQPLLERAGTVVAYGEQATLDSLERRAAGRLVGFGPRTSVAVVGASADPAAAARGLARDVALFDQRGCLSVAAVFTAGRARELADRLAAELLLLASAWPPGPFEPAAAAGVRQLRAEAELRALYRPESPLGAGTVVVEDRTALAPSPGLRSVRVHPLTDLDRLPALLAPWRGRLQGAALAGDDAWALRPELEALGISRCAAPGELQSPDALWHNGGLHPLAALAGR